MTDDTASKPQPGWHPTPARHPDANREMKEIDMDETGGIQRHAFVESGPGQEPTTIRGCIVCPSCYQPKRSPVHSPYDWRQDGDTWVCAGFGEVVTRSVLRAEGTLTRYVPFDKDGRQLNNGWQRLDDAKANVEANAQGRTY